MRVAVCGLGKMGMQIVQRLIEEGHEVIAYDRDPKQVDIAEKLGASASQDADEIISIMKDGKKIIWLMIPAGAVDEAISDWSSRLTKGDVIIDGGNSNFELTKKRYELLQQKGIELMDVGTSGGILGLENGFSLMVGGDDIVYEGIKPLLEALGKPNGSYAYFGPSGSGHFVKMVHNAIEYGMMESLAEGYRVLKEGPYKELDLVKAGLVWQDGSIIESSLNGLTMEALKENPDLEGIDGYVAESGEAKWTLDVAKEFDIEMPAIQSSLDVRIKSQNGQVNFATKLLAAMRNKFGGHSLNK
jgi:6-phosphogluconate dehydrogenase